MKQLFAEEVNVIEIFGTLLFLVIIGCWVGCLINGACTTFNCKKEGKQAFDQMSIAKDANWKVQADRDDIYYKPDSHAIIGPNPCFYSDGSLKYDSLTGKSYPKGKYYCQSDGSKADWSMASSNMRRPPRR